MTLSSTLFVPSAGFVTAGEQRERALMLEMATDKDYAAHRVSYQLNLTGPSVCIQTSCSTSLSCVAMACGDLALGHSDRAIAAAASLVFPRTHGYLYLEGMPESRTGRCRTFDAAASGTVFGDGTGTVMLRPMSGPNASVPPGGDTVLAVIVGYGINNDGKAKMSFNAPSVSGQRDAVIRAFR
jgi:acyl transferase domain-containing protein